jgi:predicted DNA-binding transcriptional regulator YafY
MDLEVRPATFKRPAKFDPRSYLKQRMPFIQSDYQIDIWIDMPIEEAKRTFAPWRVATEKDQDGTRLRCGRDRLQLFAAMLLSMGRRIVIYKPAELRETFRELARQALLVAQPPAVEESMAASD